MLERPVAALVAAGLSLFASPAFTAEAVCPSEGSRPLHVANAVTGDTLMTLEGAEIRLAGILAPGPETSAANEEAAILARGDLAARLEGRAVTVSEGTTDRYGRLVAQVFVDGRNLQEALLRAGMALAAPDIASGPCAAPLLAAEAEARASGAGYWGNGVFRILTLAELMAGEENLAEASRSLRRP